MTKVRDFYVGHSAVIYNTTQYYSVTDRATIYLMAIKYYLVTVRADHI